MDMFAHEAQQQQQQQQPRRLSHQQQHHHHSSQQQQHQQGDMQMHTISQPAQPQPQSPPQLEHHSMEQMDDEWHAVLLGCLDENLDGSLLVQTGECNVVRKRPRSEAERDPSFAGSGDDNAGETHREKKKTRERERRKDFNEKFNELVDVLCSFEEGAQSSGKLRTACKGTIVDVAVATLKTLAADNARLRQEQLLTQAAAKAQSFNKEAANASAVPVVNHTPQLGYPTTPIAPTYNPQSGYSMMWMPVPVMMPHFSGNKMCMPVSMPSHGFNLASMNMSKDMGQVNAPLMPTTTTPQVHLMPCLSSLQHCQQPITAYPTTCFSGATAPFACGAATLPSSDTQNTANTHTNPAEARPTHAECA